MRRVSFALRGSIADLSVPGSPSVWILVPENDVDRSDLLDAMRSQGIVDRMGFADHGVKGSLRFPATVSWDDGGAAELSIQADIGQRTPVWFWVVEIAESVPRRFAWWGTRNDSDQANPWQA